MVLPQRLTGTCTGTWTTLPDRTPGEPTAAPAAPASAMAMPVPLSTTAPVPRATPAAFAMRDITFSF